MPLCRDCGLREAMQPETDHDRAWRVCRECFDVLVAAFWAIPWGE